MSNKCCSPEDTERSVTVKVDVSKIVKYVCVTGTLIVAIVFGTKLYRRMLEGGFLEVIKKNK